MALTLTGTDNVLRNLNREINKIEGRSMAGLAEAALFVRAEAQRLTPVAIGNLKDSAYTEPIRGLSGPAYEIGYTALYAPFVHENPRAGKTGGVAPDGTPYPTTKAGLPTWSEVGQWKFLETALKENTVKILRIIQRRAVIR